MEVYGLEKIDRITSLLEDITDTVMTMTDYHGEDSDYKNLDEVITYLETVKCVLPQKSAKYYLERIM